jgi:hypothetical protein
VSKVEEVRILLASIVSAKIGVGDLCKDQVLQISQVQLGTVKARQIRFARLIMRLGLVTLLPLYFGLP